MSEQYKKVKSPSNDTKVKWNELFTKPMIEKRNLMVFTVLSLITNIVLSVGYINLSKKSEVAVWVVEVDQTGNAVTVGKAIKSEIDNEYVIRAHLYNFIEMTKTIITDPEAMRRNFEKVYTLITPEVQNFLNQYYRENDPMESARKISRQVIPKAFLKQSDKTFIVEWSEVDRDLSNKILEQNDWKALITITQAPPKTEKEMMEKPYNPFGIYIKNISWSRVLK